MARIPKNPRFNCYFGCDEGGPLHHFPKPHTDLERFDTWKRVLDTETKSKGNEYIYNQLRLCDKHFENYYKSPSRMLTRNAVPTLYVKDGTSASPQVEMTPSVSTELSSLSAPGTAPKVVTVPVVLNNHLKLILNTGTFASPQMDPQVEMTPVSTELSSVSAPGTASLMPKVVSVPVVMKNPLKRKLNTDPTKQHLIETVRRLTNRVAKLTQKCKAQEKIILRLKKYRR